MANVPKDLKYTREHEWAKQDGDRVRVGITAYAQEQLARHQRSEPSDHYALIRHQHAERSLRDDIAIAESDITVLSVELTRAAQGDADAA